VTAASQGLEVAVVIPVRDGAAYLAEAIESVLSQDLPPREVVVVDDGSTDRSAELAEGAGVRVLREPPRGAGAARNRGVEATASPWLAFLDADDRWTPGKLSRQAAALAASPGAVASIGRIRQFFSPETGRADAPVPEVLWAPSPVTLVVRREAFLATGGFPTDLQASEVAAWWVRFEATRPEVVRCEDVLAERRLHARNTGALRAGTARAEFLRLAKAALDARRGDR
jgi:glycosyltransferase involved in cell wall biosynthesis